MKAYCHMMSRPGVYGDHVALSLLSQALSRHIKVISTVMSGKDMMATETNIHVDSMLHDKSYLVLGHIPEIIHYVSLCIDG